ncbi:MAG: sulfotransferase domain-containing protein [Acidimicrobiia bacterium]
MRANAIIAGVNKAGTTSLFVSLSSHPDVAAAAVKETRYFLPARWGQDLESVDAYDACFVDASPTARVRLEATPSYFYGGDAVIDAMRSVCGDDLRIVVVLREPVARFWSFFTFQKARLRIPEDLGVDEYLAHADTLTDDDFRVAENERWFAFRGGCYADWLPVWHAAFGERLKIAFFEDLMAEPDRVLRDAADFFGIDPDAFPSTSLASENRTTGYRRVGLQRVALAFNDRFERFLRRHYSLKDRLRSVYYRLNGSARREQLPPAARAMLVDRYAEPNARLARQLVEMDVTDVPAWCAATVG